MNAPASPVAALPRLRVMKAPSGQHLVETVLLDHERNDQSVIRFTGYFGGYGPDVFAAALQMHRSLAELLRYVTFDDEGDLDINEFNEMFARAEAAHDRANWEGI